MSAINPAMPAFGSPTTASVRANFETARAEISALQNNVSAVQYQLGEFRTLHQNLDLYVAADGSDFAGDGTQARPFRQIQRAINEIYQINGNNYEANVSVGPGIYESFLFYGPVFNFSWVEIAGGSADPADIAATIIRAPANGKAIDIGFIHNVSIARVSIEGVNTTNTTGLTVWNYGSVYPYNIRWGPCQTHMESWMGYLSTFGLHVIYGDAAYHAHCAAPGATLELYPSNYQILGNRNIGVWARVQQMGLLVWSSGPVTGGTVTGKRYEVGVLSVLRNEAAAALPGTIAGTVDPTGVFQGITGLAAPLASAEPLPTDRQLRHPLPAPLQRRLENHMTELPNGAENRIEGGQAQ
jgi:hypothetical protein